MNILLQPELISRTSKNTSSTCSTSHLNGVQSNFCRKTCLLEEEKSKPQSELPNLYKVQVHELIHPQLRIFRWLSQIDQIYRRKQLLRLVSLHGIDLHFSFYLDAHCLLPNIPRIQIINDDFVGAATWISKKTTKIDFQLSVRSAHKTLTVSYPLNEKVARAGGDPRLFLPGHLALFQIRLTSLKA